MTPERVRRCGLTRPVLWNAAETRATRMIPLPDSIDIHMDGKEFILGIYAPASTFMKITSYFLPDPDVTKLTLLLDHIDNDKIVAVSNIINDVKDVHIHVSGFCQKHEHYVYEIYARGKKDVFSNTIEMLQALPFAFDHAIEEIVLTPMTNREQPATS